MLEYLTSLTSSFSLVIFTVTLAVVYVINSWLRHPSDLPPMPCRPVPILGHILYFKPTQLTALWKWKKELGDIFCFYVGSKLFVSMNSYPILHEALIKQADHFSDRPPSFKIRDWPEQRYGISANSGPSWKEQRTLSMSILREFGMGKNWLAEKISEEVEDYIKVLEGMKGEARDLQILTNTSVSNVICAILLGKRFEYDDPFLTGFVKQSIEQLQLIGKTGIVHVLPWLRHLPGDKFSVKKQLANSLRMNKMFSDKFISQFRDNADDTSTDNFIKAYLREMYKRAKTDPNSDLNEMHLSRIIDSLFLGGTDTTSTTLLWAMAYSMHYPDCQKKAFEEINEVVGTERIPRIQDKPLMPYFNAFMLETQRLGSVLPKGVPHICSKTTYVGGYRIPAGATVLPFLDAVLKDEKVWKDPHIFRPERFLNEDGKLSIPDEFVPFSLGRRMCMGESLAKMELFLFLSSIMQRFEFLPEDPNNLPPLVSSDGITSCILPFRVRMKARS